MICRNFYVCYLHLLWERGTLIQNIEVTVTKEKGVLGQARTALSVFKGSVAIFRKGNFFQNPVKCFGIFYEKKIII